MLDVILNLPIYPEAKKLMPKLTNFMDTYNNLKNEYNNLSLDDFVLRVIDDFKIRDAFPKDSDESTDKLMNIDQFENSVKMFVENNPDSTIADYLESVTLQSDMDTMSDEDNVTVATVHAVKGLEFKVVFVVGLEEGVFPLSRSLENKKELQEERRLAYVAYTRAGERLYVSSCKTRYLYGRRNYERESRFLAEAGLMKARPKKIFEFDDDYSSKNENGFKDSFSKTTISPFSTGYNTKTNDFKSTFIPKPNKSNYVDINKSDNSVDIDKYKVGQVVGHPKFGVGTIISITSNGKIADIDFGALGKKSLMLEIAPLKIIKG